MKELMRMFVWWVIVFAITIGVLYGAYYYFTIEITSVWDKSDAKFSQELNQRDRETITADIGKRSFDRLTRKYGQQADSLSISY